MKLLCTSKLRIVNVSQNRYYASGFACCHSLPLTQQFLAICDILSQITSVFLVIWEFGILCCVFFWGVFVTFCVVFLVFCGFETFWYSVVHF